MDVQGTWKMLVKDCCAAWACPWSVVSCILLSSPSSLRKTALSSSQMYFCFFTLKYRISRRLYSSKLIVRFVSRMRTRVKFDPRILSQKIRIHNFFQHEADPRFSKSFVWIDCIHVSGQLSMYIKVIL